MSMRYRVRNEPVEEQDAAFVAALARSARQQGKTVAQLTEIELALKEGRYLVPAERVAEALIKTIVAHARESAQLLAIGREFGRAFS